MDSYSSSEFPKTWRLTSKVEKQKHSKIIETAVTQKSAGRDCKSNKLAQRTDQNLQRKRNPRKLTHLI